MFETATRVEYKPEIGTQNSEKTAATISSHTRDRKLEIRNQKSETRTQKSEIRNQQLCKFADQQSKNGSFVINQQDSKGNDVHLSTYKGKVLLFVNVASKCGLTNSNYTELNHLYEKYKDQGLEILAFPCNQFGEEEPGSNLEINEFVCTRFKSEFPIFDKVEVNGENAVPVYKFLKSGKWGFFKDDIQWNFSKFLVDKSGKVVDRYYPTTSPLTIEHDIKKLLGVES